MRLKLAKFAGLAILGSVFVLSSCSSSSAQPQQHAQSDRKTAPDFTLQDEQGASVKLSDFRGKVVLLNFWATWCGPCNLEIPWFVEFQQQYKSAGLEVVGVSMDDDGWKVVKPYIHDHHINYEILLGNDSVTQLYGGVDSLPTTFIIDRGGHIAHVHVGLAGKNEYLDEIQKLLTPSPAHQASLHVAPVCRFVAWHSSISSSSLRRNQFLYKGARSVDARVSVAILPGFHVNSDKPSFDYLIPLKLTWSSGPLEAKSVRYPQPETIELGPDKLSVFSGTIDITTKFIAPKNAAAGSTTMTGQLHYQACNNRECFRPMTVEVRLPVTVE